MSRFVSTAELRSRFAAALSALYAREVPAYRTLVEVTQRVNAQVRRREGRSAGDGDRVDVERHGAIRVGSARELAAVARLFAGLGMHPVGCYDLRASGVPVVATAFRPIEQDELAANPFRVFTSMLTLDDRTSFTQDLADRAQRFLDARRLLSEELLVLADRAAANGGLDHDDAAALVTQAAASFQLTTTPVDRTWYAELAAVSPVAADIAGVPTTHLNHLTPRVLDIDELWQQMTQAGVEMIPEIQGPPRWDGPDVLLRQTSFQALAERRLFREPDGSTSEGRLRVRFGEVEARGIALTPVGAELYATALHDVDARCAAEPDVPRQVVLRQVWERTFPHTERELLLRGLGVFTVAPVLDRARDGREPAGSLLELLDAGFLTATPVGYEDFLPRSAAGIFRSNLDGAPRAASGGKDRYDGDRLEGILDRPLHDAHDLYRQQADRSVRDSLTLLGLQEART